MRVRKDPSPNKIPLSRAPGTRRREGDAAASPSLSLLFSSHDAGGRSRAVYFSFCHSPTASSSQRLLYGFSAWPLTPHGAGPVGTPFHCTCAGGVNPPLRQGFRLWRKPLYAASAAMGQGPPSPSASATPPPPAHRSGYCTDSPHGP